MNCPICNSPLQPGEKFCQNCGTKLDSMNNTTTAQPSPAQAAPVVNGSAINPAVGTNAVNPGNAQAAPMSQPTANVAVPPAPVLNNQEYMAMQNNNSSNQKGAPMFLLIIMAVAIIALGGALVYFVVFAKDDNKENENSNKQDSPVVTAMNRQTYQGYQFEAPEGWNFEKGEKDLTIYTDNEEVVISSQILKNTYSSVVLALPQIEAAWTQSGYQLSNRQTANKNGKNYYIYDLSFSGYNGYIVLTDLSSQTLLSIILAQNTNALTKYKEVSLNIVTSLQVSNTASISPIEDPMFTNVTTDVASYFQNMSIESIIEQAQQENSQDQSVDSNTTTPDVAQ